MAQPSEGDEGEQVDERELVPFCGIQRLSLSTGAMRLLMLGMAIW